MRWCRRPGNASRRRCRVNEGHRERDSVLDCVQQALARRRFRRQDDALRPNCVLHLTAPFGQKTGAQQTFLLHQIDEAAMGQSVEIE